MSVEAIPAGAYARYLVIFGAPLDLLAAVATCLHFRLARPCSARLLALIGIEALRLCYCCVCPGATTNSSQATFTVILFDLALVVVRGPEPGVFGASIPHKKGSPLNTVAWPTVGCTSIHRSLIIKTSACRVKFHQLVTHSGALSGESKTWTDMGNEDGGENISRASVGLALQYSLLPSG